MTKRKRMIKLCTLFIAASMCCLNLTTCAKDSSLDASSSKTSSDVQTENEENDNDALNLNADTKEATEYTKQANEAVYGEIDFKDTDEYDNATKGLIAAPETLEITDENGKVVWSQDAYTFLEDDASDTANPSLWRNAQLNNIYGLFEVTDGIYQVRGYDMSNITFIESDNGWIVFDPLMSIECSQAAKELVDEYLGERDIMGIVISHSHINHYGGIKGIVTDEYVEENDIPIIVPEGFEEHAVSENVYAGTAMSRRASYQYGTYLDQSETGKLSIGIGMGQSTGTTSYMSPTMEITETGQTVTVDGVTMEFQLTPGTEAPAEMNTWFPDKNALWIAENCTGTMHNLYTLRGAEVRDGLEWAKYLLETLDLYGEDVETVFQSHNWPHWGNETINTYIEDTAVAYKFINDQTLMYINQGYTETEIANMIELPEDLQKVWYIRQYYGTVSHNAKAVYQKYMGWYDANPVNLAELTPTESAEKYVEYMGDTDEILKKAMEDYENGEYQWVAQITNILVYVDPDNMDARYLCADALEQLGYQAESGTWRNAYLAGAKELREGTIIDDSTRASQTTDIAQSMDTELLLDYLAINIDSNAAENLSFTANLIITDTEKEFLLTVKCGILLYTEGKTSDDADVTWTTTKAGLSALAYSRIESLDDVFVQDGDTELLPSLMTYIQTYDRYFNIIEP